MSAEILFLDIIGNILLSEETLDFNELSNEEIDNIFDFHLAQDKLDLEDDAINRPNIHLFRNKLNIKLIRKYGLLGSIKATTDLLINMEIITKRNGIRYANINLCEVALKASIERLDGFYKVLVLEKISILLTIFDQLKSTSHSFNWLFQENDIFNLVCTREDKSNQIYLDGYESPFYEIPHNEDEKYQRRVYHQKYYRKEKAYKNIIDYIPSEEIDSKISELKKLLNSIYSLDSINLIDYGYFYYNATEVLDTLKDDLHNYRINHLPKEVDSNQLSFL